MNGKRKWIENEVENRISKSVVIGRGIDEYTEAPPLEMYLETGVRNYTRTSDP